MGSGIIRISDELIEQMPEWRTYFPADTTFLDVGPVRAHEQRYLVQSASIADDAPDELSPWLRRDDGVVSLGGWWWNGRLVAENG